MKVIELIKISRKTLEVMSERDIKTSDYKFVEMYDEYKVMRDSGEKYWYIVASLAEKYKTSESSIKRAVKRLSGEVIL